MGLPIVSRASNWKVGMGRLRGEEMLLAFGFRLQVIGFQIGDFSYPQ
jgi:hypothetical protein